MSTSASKKSALIARIKALPDATQQKLIKSWPTGVPSLKSDGYTHTAEQLRTVSAIVAVLEEEVGKPTPDQLRGRVHAACTEAFGNADDERHALISWATNGVKKSSTGLTEDEAQAVVDAATKVVLGELVLGFKADGGEPFWQWAADVGARPTATVHPVPEEGSVVVVYFRSQVISGTVGPDDITTLLELIGHR